MDLPPAAQERIDLDRAGPGVARVDQLERRLGGHKVVATSGRGVDGRDLDLLDLGHRGHARAIGHRVRWDGSRRRRLAREAHLEREKSRCRHCGRCHRDFDILNFLDRPRSRARHNEPLRHNSVHARLREPREVAGKRRGATFQRQKRDRPREPVLWVRKLRATHIECARVELLELRFHGCSVAVPRQVARRDRPAGAIRVLQLERASELVTCDELLHSGRGTDARELRIRADREHGHVARIERTAGRERDLPLVAMLVVASDAHDVDGLDGAECLERLLHDDVGHVIRNLGGLSAAEAERERAARHDDVAVHGRVEHDVGAAAREEARLERERRYVAHGRGESNEPRVPSLRVCGRLRDALHAGALYPMTPEICLLPPDAVVSNSIVNTPPSTSPGAARSSCCRAIVL
ncbi:hypothetical protein FI667_g16418, partial [Globisporangium splendens]